MDESREVQEVTEATPATEQTPRERPRRAPKKRRGRVRYAAPLGFLVLLFACIGVISTLVGGINLVRRWNDDTPLKQELSLFLDPVMQMCPPPFDNAGETQDQDTLVMAAIYDIAETERIRQLREKDDTCRYPLEETLWRMVVPQADVEKAFTALFGNHTIRQHHTVGEAEYVADKQVYYVPLTLSTSGYVPVVDTVRRKGDTYTVRVAYVSEADIEVDERGNAVAPSANKGKYVQRYTVQKNEDKSYTLLAVAAEEQTAPKAPLG